MNKVNGILAVLGALIFGKLTYFNYENGSVLQAIASAIILGYLLGKIKMPKWQIRPKRKVSYH